jgi:hypothetical protein
MIFSKNFVPFANLSIFLQFKKYKKSLNTQTCKPIPFQVQQSASVASAPTDSWFFREKQNPLTSHKMSGGSVFTVLKETVLFCVFLRLRRR